MSLQDVYLDNVFIQWNEVDGHKVTIGIDNESHQIFNNVCVLSQIPDIGTKVTIEGMYEIPIHAKINHPSQFKVNYANGFITFHPDLNNTTINIKHYAGRGIIYYPSERIWVKLSEDGKSVEETFQDYINSIIPYSYKDIYDDDTIYYANNQVYYEGSTYICTAISSQGNKPTDGNYWRILGAGLSDVGVYDSDKQYHPRDVVKFDNGIYQCYKKPPIGTLPTDENYFIEMVSIKSIVDEYYNNLRPNIINATNDANDAAIFANEKAILADTKASLAQIAADNANNKAELAQTATNNANQAISVINNFILNLESVYSVIDNSITITHNTDSYPLPHVINMTGVGYGNLGFGMFGFGGTENKYQIFSRAEYLDKNTIKLYLEEEYTGTPTITIISATEYDISFSNESIKLILK